MDTAMEEACLVLTRGPQEMMQEALRLLPASGFHTGTTTVHGFCTILRIEAAETQSFSELSTVD
jgi:hypothetical protein